MSVRAEIPENDSVYFITFTFCNWLPLFEIAKGYQSVYDWFDYLKAKGHLIVGYVIMPNHVHVIIAFRNTKGKSINKIVGNGKRFIAYDLSFSAESPEGDSVGCLPAYDSCEEIEK